MSRRVGYVVVEWNQASGLPSVSTYSGFGGDIYDTIEEATEILDRTRAEMAGRRNERYAICDLYRLKEAGDASPEDATAPKGPGA